MNYPVYIHSEEGVEGFGVIVPDLPGCVSHGDDVVDAYRMACEAVQLHVETMIEDGDSLPSPRGIEEIVAHDDLADYDAVEGFWAFVRPSAPLDVAA